ncbi:FdtA/QdtA family cupin domain-containing protein [Dyadobacter sp. CY347]|uniref:sugar 3,4-ketoisomerase n=1 Tax=Dyadobacter sp. CY347 TaxID=2909336 RepID=UPI001F2978F6|nr:FdtA/QdtA family cupin domain-containing protein [Dyadobacter sp. CY347]MCF2491475.1 FdtA/QdtA family cupin domain-containing protein [Dyadobacter sp. CY347]
MATIICQNELGYQNGDLSTFTGIVPGEIKRIFYIYGAKGQRRGGHRHHQSWNILICLSGKCRIYCNDGETEKFFYLNDPKQCLVIQPKEWHIMDRFSHDAILLVLANTYYNENDYIYEPYAKDKQYV